jgi:hypothetical protein
LALSGHEGRYEGRRAFPQHFLAGPPIARVFYHLADFAENERNFYASSAAATASCMVLKTAGIKM